MRVNFRFRFIGFLAYDAIISKPCRPGLGRNKSLACITPLVPLWQLVSKDCSTPNPAVFDMSSGDNVHLHPASLWRKWTKCMPTVWDIHSTRIVRFASGGHQGFASSALVVVLQFGYHFGDHFFQNGVVFVPSDSLKLLNTVFALKSNRTNLCLVFLGFDERLCVAVLLRKSQLLLQLTKWGDAPSIQPCQANWLCSSFPRFDKLFLQSGLPYNRY